MGDKPSTCSPEINSTWSKELTDFLKNPTPEGSKFWTQRLCQALPEGLTPCPLPMSDERVNDFSLAAEKSPLVISLIACAGPLAEGPNAEELLELQSRLLDRYKSKFFIQWMTLPKEFFNRSQKFEEFASLTPDAPDDFEKKIKILQSRIEILEAAPPKFREFSKGVLSKMKEDISASKKTLNTKEDGEISFKISGFRKQLTEKLIHLPTFDAARATVLANEILLNEGLNFKTYLKTSNNNWSVCSASTNAQEGACHNTTVAFPKGHDHCGSYALLGLLFQAGQTWVVMSGSSSYRIEIKDLLAPVSLTLVKNSETYRQWNIPEGFVPEFLSPDLHSLYSRMTLYTDEGKKLVNLHLVMRDNGRFQFLELPREKLVRISGKAMQDVTGIDGSTLEFRLPKVCH